MHDGTSGISRPLPTLKRRNNPILPKVTNVVAQTLAASEAWGMRTGSGENNPAKTNHIWCVFRNLSNQIVFKGSLSWSARVSFQAECFLGEGIMLMVPDTFVFLPRPWKYKCRQTHRGPQGDFCLWGREQLVVLGSGEFLNPWKFPLPQVWMAAPGWWDHFILSNLEVSTAIVWKWPLQKLQLSAEWSLALSPGPCLTGKDGFGGFLVCNFNMIYRNSLACN